MDLTDKLANLIEQALEKAQNEGVLPASEIPESKIEHPQNPEHGDFATSLPLKLARTMKLRPMDIAQHMVAFIPECPEISHVEVAPPGFINFTLASSWLQEQVNNIIEAGSRFGSNSRNSGKRIQIEFVSVNPTGPIHVGHARGAVMGSSLSSILETTGYEVNREYYINDAGNQMDLFFRSLLARYLEIQGKTTEFPEGGYKGGYMTEIASDLLREKGDHVPSSVEEGAIDQIGPWSLHRMLSDIEKDLKGIGVVFDSWFSEKSLFESGIYSKTMDILAQKGFLTEKDGATWFMSSELGEDKDNVVIRGDGSPTYFASDAAYHFNKFLVRGYDKVIDIWGADHQGHVGRLYAALTALGIEPKKLTIIISQLVALKRDGVVVRASKRTGELITLKELLEEVGSDACRYFFLTRSPDSQMEFDIDLATKQTQENPVYYIQYAFARISGIIRQANDLGLTDEKSSVEYLSTEEEFQLIRKVLQFPELINLIAETLEPHHLPHYALELATTFHSFYDRCRVISDDVLLTNARLRLVRSAEIALKKSLELMGMNAPERM